MPADTEKVDLRLVKTEKAIDIAILALLRKYNFGKISVRNICEEAFISRATFYTHFADKYDMLKQWLAKMGPDRLFANEAYEQTEMMVNQLVSENQMVIRNLLGDADQETLEIILEIMLSTLNMGKQERTSRNLSPRYAVLSTFYVGGMVNYLTWQTKNNFPADVSAMNIHLYEIAMHFRKCAEEENEAM